VSASALRLVYHVIFLIIGSPFAVVVPAVVALVEFAVVAVPAVELVVFCA
jgi:hypothetical protein